MFPSSLNPSCALAALPKMVREATAKIVAAIPARTVLLLAITTFIVSTPPGEN
jgi:hypothetical protein